jgi:hypothetical protein
MIEAIFKCDYPECDAVSEPQETDYIDTHEYHDAPTFARTMDEPSGWYWNAYNEWVACPEHREEMDAHPREPHLWGKNKPFTITKGNPLG